jgi:hypothetical protein
MKTKLLITVLSVLIMNVLVAQKLEKYKGFVSKGDSLYAAKEYEKSASKYIEAFDCFDGKAYPEDRIKAACAYAMAGNNEESFYHLFYLAESKGIKYRNVELIETTPDLNSLHSDSQWDKLVALVRANKAAYEKDLDWDLVAVLDTIYESDQSIRRKLGAIEQKFGFNSKEYSEAAQKMIKIDSLNTIKVTKILDERGWLGPKIVGSKGNTALFLVIQHSPLATQEKYIPMLREAVKRGDARGSNLALMEDRVALGQGKRQIYGSQLRQNNETGELFVQPIIDPENVNERRAQVGLGTIEEYVKRFGLVWDLEKHKKKAAELEAEKE